MAVRLDTVVNNTNYSTLYAFAERLTERMQEAAREANLTLREDREENYRETAEALGDAATAIRAAADELRRVEDLAYERIYGRR